MSNLQVLAMSWAAVTLWTAFVEIRHYRRAIAEAVRKLKELQ